MTSLPKGWTITRYPDQLEVRDDKGTTKAWIPVPNTPMSLVELLEKAAPECCINPDEEPPATPQHHG
jgi:hypothetical protein